MTTCLYFAFTHQCDWNIRVDCRPT